MSRAVLLSALATLAGVLSISTAIGAQEGGGSLEISLEDVGLTEAAATLAATAGEVFVLPAERGRPPGFWREATVFLRGEIARGDLDARLSHQLEPSGLGCVGVDVGGTRIHVISPRPELADVQARRSASADVAEEAGGAGEADAEGEAGEAGSGLAFTVDGMELESALPRYADLAGVTICFPQSALMWRVSCCSPEGGFPRGAAREVLNAVLSGTGFSLVEIAGASSPIWKLTPVAWLDDEEALAATRARLVAAAAGVKDGAQSIPCDFKGVDMVMVLDVIRQATGVEIRGGDLLRGNHAYLRSPSGLPRGELLLALEAMLEQSGLRLRPEGGGYLIERFREELDVRRVGEALQGKASGAGAEPAAGVALATVRIELPESAAVGDVITAKVVIDCGERNLAAYGLELAWDPAVLKVRSVTGVEGGFEPPFVVNLETERGQLRWNGISLKPIHHGAVAVAALEVEVLARPGSGATTIGPISERQTIALYADDGLTPETVPGVQIPNLLLPVREE